MEGATEDPDPGRKEPVKSEKKAPKTRERQGEGEEEREATTCAKNPVHGYNLRQKTRARQDQRRLKRTQKHLSTWVESEAPRPEAAPTWVREARQDHHREQRNGALTQPLRFGPPAGPAPR